VAGREPKPMAQEFELLDVTDSPELLRLAREVADLDR
jgi:hypothetical protein